VAIEGGVASESAKFEAIVDGERAVPAKGN
jgi:hypothetical protein